MASSQGVKAGKAFVMIEAVDKTAFVFKRIGTRMKRFASDMNAMGQKLLTRGLAGMLPMVASVKVFANFDDAMRKVEARSGATAEEMRVLRDQAKKLGRETSFTASQIGELQSKLAQKGFDPKKISNMTPAVMDLARAAGEGGEGDTVIAADLISGTIRAFGMEAKDATHIADVFTTAVNNSNFSLEGLMDGMTKAGPLAADYGMSVEETAATLASMTNLNISASEAGTAMQSFLARMSKSQFTDQFNSSLAEMGKQTIKFRDDVGNLRKPLDLLAEIGEVTKDLGTAERGDLLSLLFGVRQFGKAAGGARGAVDAMELLNKLQNESAGNAKKTAETMDSGVGGSLRKFWSAVEGVAIAIGETLAPTIDKLTAFINENLEAFTTWVEQNQGVILAVTGIIAGVIALGVGLMALSLVISLVGTAFTVASTALMIFKGLLGILLSPVGLVIAAIAGVIAVLYQFSSDFRTIANGIAGFVSEKFSAMAGTLVTTFKGVMKALNAGDFQGAWDIAIEGLKLTWLQFVDFLKSGWAKFATFFVEAWNGASLMVQETMIGLQQKIADWLLKMAEDEGMLGDAVDVVLGVDYSEIKKKQAKLNKQAAAMGLAQQEEDARDFVRDYFRDKLDQAREDSAEALDDWNKGVDEASSQRQKEIDERRKALMERIDGLGSEEEIEEEGDGLKDAMDKAKDGLAKLTEGLGGPGSVVSPELQQGLEKGSVEAAQQFNKNLQQNNLLAKAVDLHEEEVELLGDAVEALDDPAWLAEIGFI